MGNSKKLSLAMVGIILGASLAACDDGRGDAEAAAKKLASAVAALDVSTVAFDGRDSAAVNEQLKEVFKALEPDKPTVETGELTLDGDTATIPLNYTWKIASAEWKYTVSAELRKSD
ncbi:MAG TPA: penicillin-binding protein, partial [Arthrobacter sp.]|nr:penicillin-binding protein [Arthrobacter sp.]